MSIFDRVLTGVKDVLLLRDDVSRMYEDQREMGSEIRDHERRLIRIETIIDYTERAAARRLPDQ